MTPIFPGRFTAQADKPVILFLIGMRINKLSAFGKWWPVAQAMPAMLKELRARPESGYLQGWLWGGRTTIALQYWRSFDDLVAYAHDKNGVHFPAWGKFNKAVGNSGEVGIWHETYLIEPGKFETVYGNMPLFGLACGDKPCAGNGAPGGRQRPHERVSGAHLHQRRLPGLAFWRWRRFWWRCRQLYVLEGCFRCACNLHAAAAPLRVDGYDFVSDVGRLVDG